MDRKPHMRGDEPSLDLDYFKGIRVNPACVGMNRDSAIGRYQMIV